MKIWTVFLIGLLAGCSVNKLNVFSKPPLTEEQIKADSDTCVKKGLLAKPYPANAPVQVFCETKSVLPPNYVGTPPTPVYIVNPR